MSMWCYNYKIKLFCVMTGYNFQCASNSNVIWCMCVRKVLPIKQPFSLLHPMFQTCNLFLYHLCVYSFSPSLWYISWIILNICKTGSAFVRTATQNGLPAKACNLLKILNVKSKYIYYVCVYVYIYTVYIYTHTVYMYTCVLVCYSMYLYKVYLL